MGRLLACLVIIALALGASAQTTTTPRPEGVDVVIRGQGATFPQPVYEEWLFAYNLLRPNILPTYNPTGSGAGATSARTGLDDFAGADTPNTDTNLNAFPWVDYFPSVAGQVCLMHNIPGIDSASGQLNITRDIAAGIFSNNITTWDHPWILAANPGAVAAGVVLAGKNITVVVRLENSGTTDILTTGLGRFNSSLYPYPNGQAFPSVLYTGRPNWIRMRGSTGVAGQVQTTPYSIGYAAVQFATADNIPVAAVQNKRNEFISPYNVAQSTEAISGIQLAPGTNAFDLVDFDADNIYPLASFTYLLLSTRNNSFTDAIRQRELLKIFRWAFTQDVPKQAVEKLGYINLPQSLVDFVLSNFEKYELDGQKLLRIVYLKQHTSALFEVVLAFTMFFWLISLALIGYSWWSSSRSKNPLFYAACLIVGASMAFASAIFFYLLPDSTAICELRKWLLAGGMTLLLGVMFARGWQLHALKSGPRIISTKKLLVIVSIIFGVQAILLICWTAIDTWESRTKFTNPIDLTARYECSSDHNIVWLLLELAFFLVLLAWGIYVVYATWRNRAAVDSRWTLIAVYNTLIVMLLVIPIIAVAVNSDDWVFYVAVLAMNFAVLSAVFSIYGSAVLRRIWDSVAKTSTSGDSGDGAPAKVSSLRMTVGATVNP